MRSALFALVLLSACAPPAKVEEPPRDPDDLVELPRHTPRWAFRPWISKDISTRDDTLDFVKGFKDRDIPVGVVVLDSPWETHYNSFVPNPKRYPDFAGLVSTLRAQDIRTVLWITSMVNESSFDAEPGGDIYPGASPNYGQGKNKGFYVNDAKPTVWWKGVGCGVDFFNPEAVKWWHRQQDKTLALGISGWKLDFADEYFPDATVKTAAGVKTRQEYGEAYYRDMLLYPANKLGKDEFTTMSRPWDESYGFPGRFFAKKEHNPIGWVGDQRRDWIGLEDALDHIFRSAVAGYVMLGSDIGGYLDADDLDLTGPRIPFSTVNFARWTAVGALMGFMQLHGRGNFAPWTVPDHVDETVALYKYWSWLHTELIPFFAAQVEKGELIKPIGAGPAQWKGDYRYQLADAFLVAPILNDSGKRDVTLPAGARWYDWWDADGAPLAPGTTLPMYDATDRARIPLFVREGALVPLDVRNAYTGIGNASHAGKLTLLAWPGPTESTFVSSEPNASGSATGKRLSFTAAQGAYVKLWVDSVPAQVSREGVALPKFADKAALDAAVEGWAPARGQFIWVKTAARAEENRLAW